MKVREAVLGVVGSGAMRVLGGSLRWELEDEAGYLTRELGRPLLVAAWHNRILALPLCYQWLCAGRRPLTVLTSPSRDGGLLEALVAQFGIGAVRGSSSKRGGAALRELVSEIKQGRDVIITPDGPRGPRYELHPGVVYLAQLAQVPIMPVQVEYSDYWELGSWDRFRIPKPYARVKVRFLELTTVPRTGTEEAFERERLRIEGLLGEPK